MHCRLHSRYRATKRCVRQNSEPRMLVSILCPSYWGHVGVRWFNVTGLATLYEFWVSLQIQYTWSTPSTLIRRFVVYRAAAQAEGPPAVGYVVLSLSTNYNSSRSIRRAACSHLSHNAVGQWSHKRRVDRKWQDMAVGTKRESEVNIT